MNFTDSGSHAMEVTRNRGDWREVVQVLLALTIISTVAAVSGALSALGLLPQRRRPQPQTVVIVRTSIEVLADEPQPDPPREGDPGKELASNAIPPPAAVRGRGLF